MVDLSMAQQIPFLVTHPENFGKFHSCPKSVRTCGFLSENPHGYGSSHWVLQSLDGTPDFEYVFSMFKCDPYPAVRLHVHDDHRNLIHFFHHPIINGRSSGSNRWRYVNVPYMVGTSFMNRSLKWPLKFGESNPSHPIPTVAGVCRHRLSPPCRSRPRRRDAMVTPWGVKKDGTFPMETW